MLNLSLKIVHGMRLQAMCTECKLNLIFFWFGVTNAQPCLTNNGFAELIRVDLARINLCQIFSVVYNYTSYHEKTQSILLRTKFHTICIVLTYMCLVILLY